MIDQVEKARSCAGFMRKEDWDLAMFRTCKKVTHYWSYAQGGKWLSEKKESLFSCEKPVKNRREGVPS